MRPTEKGQGDEEFPAASLAWCPKPCTSTHKDAQEMGFPKGPSNTRQFLPHQLPVHNQLPEQKTSCQISFTLADMLPTMPQKCIFQGK